MALAESRTMEYRTAEKRMAEDAEAAVWPEHLKAHLAMVRLQEDHEASEEERNQQRTCWRKRSI